MKWKTNVSCEILNNSLTKTISVAWYTKAIKKNLTTNGSL